MWNAKKYQSLGKLMEPLRFHLKWDINPWNEMEPLGATWWYCYSPNLRLGNESAIGHLHCHGTLEICDRDLYFKECKLAMQGVWSFIFVIIRGFFFFIFHTCYSQKKVNRPGHTLTQILKFNWIPLDTNAFITLFQASFTASEFVYAHRYQSCINLLHTN
jgi:hypothetical protein